MDFISNKAPQVEEMLKAIGLKSIEELFEAIPSALRVKRPLPEDGLSEYEGLRLMEELAAKNTFPSYENYLGAGAYEHHVPALVERYAANRSFSPPILPIRPKHRRGCCRLSLNFSRPFAH